MSQNVMASGTGCH